MIVCFDFVLLLSLKNVATAQYIAIYTWHSYHCAKYSLCIHNKHTNCSIFSDISNVYSIWQNCRLCIYFRLTRTSVYPTSSFLLRPLKIWLTSIKNGRAASCGLQVSGRTLCGQNMRNTLLHNINIVMQLVEFCLRVL